MSMTRPPASAITQTGGLPARSRPVSPLLTAAAVLLAGLWMLRWIGPAMLLQWRKLLEQSVSGLSPTASPQMAAQLWPLIGWLAAFAAGLAAVAFAVTLLQRGGLERPPTTDHPRSVFGFRPHQPGLMPLAALVLFFTGAWKIWTQLPAIQALLQEGRLPQMGELFFGTVQTLAVLALAFGLLDLAWRHYVRLAEQEIRKTAEEESDDLHPLFRRQMRERMSRVL